MKEVFENAKEFQYLIQAESSGYAAKEDLNLTLRRNAEVHLSLCNF